jgi:hypothetical protein
MEVCELGHTPSRYLLRHVAFSELPYSQHKQGGEASCSGRYVCRTPSARAVPVDPWLAPVDADRDRSDQIWIPDFCLRAG